MTLANILTASLLLPGVVAAGGGHARSGNGLGGAVDPSPQITIWTNHAEDVFERGDRMTVFVRTDVDAYVTIFRVNTDGHAQVLYPARPYDDNYVRGVEALAVPGTRDGYTLRVQEYPGEGFLFAVVTLDPVAFADFARGSEWDYQALGLAGRVTGDPYVLFSDLLAALVPETYPDFSWAVIPYHVGARHDYPRFLCYQCHAYVSPVVWNPYAHTCIRIGAPKPVWWQYPHGAYDGTVVVGPPRRVPPGFVVQPRVPTASPVGPRGRGTPVAGAPTGRRPAPLATAPPVRRTVEPANPGRRTTAAAPPGRPAVKRAPQPKPAAAARRPTSATAAPARPASSKTRGAGTSGRRTHR
jgi:hypothetical protein